MCGLFIVWLCVCVGFVLCGCVFCNFWLCVCVVFVMFEFVFGWFVMCVSLCVDFYNVW